MEKSKKDFNVYILLTNYPDKASRTIKKIGLWNYAHSSISTSLNYHEYYSFTGKKGFRMESPIKHPTYKGEKVGCQLISIPVTEEVCKRVKNIIHEHTMKQKAYSYSYFGLASSYFGIKYVMLKKYTCAGFVASVLRKANMISAKDFKAITIPDNFSKFYKDNIVYDGSLERLVEKRLIPETTIETSVSAV